MPENKKQEGDTARGATKQTAVEQGGMSPPTISLPKGGGAIRGIGEKFAANPVTGTGSLSVPIYTSPGRSGFGPQLSLSYDSGAGNGPFGFGWSLSLPSITRKTDKGLPRYQDTEESDVFILSGAEDLVPVLIEDGVQWQRHEDYRTVDGVDYRIQRYRPRIEGLFARIERWTNLDDPTDVCWRSISRDNITTWYGKTGESRIADPGDLTRIFSWLICQSYDDKGNAIVYEYVEENSDRIFEDDQGDQVSLVHERNRVDDTRKANRYLKRIKYGNRTPNRDADWKATDPTSLQQDDWMFKVVFDYGEGHYVRGPNQPPPDQHEYIQATLAPTHSWPVRRDPFSSYRAGFEVRTYRLCRRVLMFHHFPDELGTDDYLVRSTAFTYRESPIASFITSVTQSGYVHQPTPSLQNRYLKKSLPPLEFEYSQPIIHDEVIEVDAASLENLPYGLDGSTYRWVDLDGEGLSGVLTEQGGAWFYKRNLSPAPSPGENGQDGIKARFGSLQRVAVKPSLAALGSGGQQFLDLAGDGQLDLATFAGPTPGFYERTQDESWGAFRTFTSLPNLAWDDPNLKFVDLTGDGHADILVTEDQVFTWYLSLAEAGFGSAESVHQALDEETGPQLVFADGTQSIYLTDLSGDGLPDLARIRNGEVCYWPNLGYGRFGAKVTMDDAPWFDYPDQFDQQRIRLADIDGSGTTDIIYLGGDGVDLYFNQAGNSWSKAQTLTHFLHTNNLSSVMAVDLLGNGTACLVWSSPLPGDAQQPMRYIDLMGGRKPHLLVKVVNNLGAETHMHYAPSTRFYLADKEAGKPWVTKLPFPVHVVERVETYDWISRNRFVTRYAYHHGYFDGVEREFRGFGMVEQWDTEEFATLEADGMLKDAENLDEASHVPPVLTKTWFHTGAYARASRISRQFGDEYYREGDPSLGEAGLSDAQLQAILLEDTLLPNHLSPDEAREACRALKGSILHQEVYAQDKTEEEDRPYLVSERNYTVKRPQPRDENKHAVLFIHPCETIDFHYERKLYDIGGRKRADPRVSHTMTLEVDDYGNVLRSAAIGYGRRYDDPDPLLTLEDRSMQKRTLITYTENRYTNAVIEDDSYRTPLLCETRTYELSKASASSSLPDVTNLFRFDEMQNRIQEAGDGGHDLPYEDVAATGATENHPYRRLIEHMRTLYRSNDLDSPLTLGQIQSLALPFESYKLAFTPGLVVEAYGGRLTDAMLGNDGHYVHTERDANWWIPSGKVSYSPNSDDIPTRELAFARDHFFLPLRYRDPFHTDLFKTETTVTYDRYDLLIQETHDPLGNIVSAGERDSADALVAQGNDYRVLQPSMVMDPNRNRSAVAFDALGMVVGTAVMGKPEENPVPGDRLEATFRADLTQAETDQFSANPTGPIAATLLDQATTRIVYDLDRFRRTQAANPGDSTQWLPPFAATLARETHVSDLQAGQQTKIQISFSYSDGFGREIQKKIQAEDGPLVDGGPIVSLRWVGSGWTIFNNKGKPVRQYEPFFSQLPEKRHRFEFDMKIGVSPILFYDPVERAVATLHPNHTWVKVVFDPWRQATWDVNDTVTLDPQSDQDVKGFFVNPDGTHRLPESEYLPTWYDLRTDAAKALQAWPDADANGQPLPDNARRRAAEREAAEKAAVHADTPTVTHFDSLGRTFLTVAHNRFERKDSSGTAQPFEKKCLTRVNLDPEGNQRDVIDAQQRIVIKYDYDMLGNQVHQASMEAGERWTLNDVTGQPIYTWDSRGHVIETQYDELRRPTQILVQGIEGYPTGHKVLVEEIVYGESQGSIRNHRGQIYRQYDAAGIVAHIGYDFKGNLEENSRQLTDEYKKQIDWSAPPGLTETFTSATRYDALNRPIQFIAPHSDQPGTKVNVVQPIYNEANLLEQMHAWLNQNSEPTDWLDPATANMHAVTNIDYNAKGQREQIEYGNGVVTTYEYDPLTFRLVHLLTRRDPGAFPGDCSQRPPDGWPGCQVQSLDYTYDPAGNITHIRDNAQQTIYFHSQRVEPSAGYTYDAIYRLIEATGREHLGQAGGAPISHSYNDARRTGIWNAGPGNGFQPGDGNAMGRYCERYVYDAVGNIIEMSHHRSCPDIPSWTRTYAYDESSLIEPIKQSNRLTSTTVSGRQATYSVNGDGYDPHGNMLHMPHLHVTRWDFKDQLHMTQRQAVNNEDEEGTLKQGERTYYVYDAAGQRVHKVTELATGNLKDERIYLGEFEIYRKHSGANSGLVRESLHVVDDKQRIALVETRNDVNDGSLKQLTRYQFGNHLGSASLELDGSGQVISYEEYTPYGSTSYQAVRSQTETPKRYRYTGKERDEESGLCYHGARYYAPWLGKWTSTDPEGLIDGLNLYQYSQDNPVRFLDTSGNISTGTEEKQRTTQTPPQKTNEESTEASTKASDRTVSRPKPKWIGENLIIPKPVFDSLKKSLGVDDEHIRLTPIEDKRKGKPYIRVTRDGRKVRFDLPEDYGILQIDENYEGAKSPFLWRLLEKTIESKERVVMGATHGVYIPVMFHAREGDEVRSWRDKDILRNIGQTVISRGLQVSKHGGLLPEGKKSPNFTSQYEDLSMIFYMKNKASDNDIVHEILGHFYLATQGLPFDHSEDLTGKVRDVSGKPFKGTVLQWIENVVEKEAERIRKIQSP